MKTTSSSPVVSIVVPAYNVEKFLHDCIQSVVRQTYRDIEIIIVDDGSTDSSSLLCDEWASRDGRIKVVHKENQGLNYARKSGFEASTGDWIVFVDGDDIVHKNFVEYLLKAVQDEHANIAVSAFEPFTRTTGTDDGGPLDYWHEESKDKVMKWFLTGNYDAPQFLIMTAWGKLFRRDLISTIDWEYANYRANEDEFMAIQYYAHADEGAVFVANQLYKYRQNPDSITNTVFKNSYHGEDLSKFDTLEHIYIKGRDYLKGEYEEELLFRFQVQYLMFINLYIETNRLTDDDFSAYSRYFLPRIKSFGEIRSYQLRKSEQELFDVIKDRGLMYYLTSQISDLKRKIEDRDKEIHRLATLGVVASTRRLGVALKTKAKKTLRGK